MAKKSAKENAISEVAKEVSKRGPARPHPSVGLKEAALLAQAIRDNNAGKPMNRILLAQAMGRSPAASDFRDLVTASSKYGFTRGGYHADVIELEELGERLTSPRNHQDQLDALREGMQRIPVYSQLLQHFANSKLPTTELLKSTLERPPFSVRPEWSQETAKMFVENGRDVGFVRNVGGSQYVILEAGPPTEDVAGAPAAPPLLVETGRNGQEIAGTQDMQANPKVAGVEERDVSQHSTEAGPSLAPIQQPAAKPVQFFIAHGWDKDALQQLKDILGRFDIPYVVAQDEPNAGRPISLKVRDLMKSCSAGIFIFSADEEFKDKDGNTIWRPRENVIYELGAASLEYENRIVIFKEKSVSFPTDFSDLGRIDYEKGNLRAKAMDLLMELIALKAVRITAGS